MKAHVYPTRRDGRSPFSFSIFGGNQSDPLRSVCGERRYKHYPLDDDSELCEDCVKGAKYQLGFTYRARLGILKEKVS
jgi:hypothetical protein